MDLGKTIAPLLPPGCRLESIRPMQGVWVKVNLATEAALTMQQAFALKGAIVSRVGGLGICVLVELPEVAEHPGKLFRF